MHLPVLITVCGPVPNTEAMGGAAWPFNWEPPLNISRRTCIDRTYVWPGYLLVSRQLSADVNFVYHGVRMRVESTCIKLVVKSTALMPSPLLRHLMARKSHA